MEQLLEQAAAAIDQHGHLALTSARWDGDALVLRLEVVEDRSEQPNRTAWAVTSSRVREHRLALGWSEEVALASDHPLLWPHAHVWASVYFSARPAAPLEVAGRLWARHRELTADWMPLERFVNGDVAAVLEGGFGLLAHAPEPLADAYADVLERAGVPWSIAGRHNPAHWEDGRGSVVRGGPGHAPRVLTLDDSYVVAERFSAVRE
jgi:hypothetical protein